MEYQLIESLLSPEKKLTATVIEQVLTNRGIKIEDIPHYLNTTDEDILDPELIDNIENGVKMLIKHIANDDKIMLIVDCDADGYTSSAFFVNYLNQHFPGFVQNNLHYYLHEGKQHGIEQAMLEQAIAGNYKLVCCPDSSSNDYEQHLTLFNNGIDVLVIDHHEADYMSHHACIINNQLCDYPTKSLSGVGMVYKFCSYIDKLLKADTANDFLDLVAVGMVADVMSLKDFETKHLIFKGCNNVHNPFIKEFCQAQKYSIDRGGGLNPFTIGWYVGPAINATIRMGSLEENLILFESMLDYKAYETIPSTKRGCKGQYEQRVTQACRNCNNIKNRQTKARDAGMELLTKRIKENHLDENKIIILQTNKNEINPNLTGLIANKIMAEYQHPTLLLMKKIDDTGEILLEGSGRGFPTKELPDLRQFVLDSTFAYFAAGHASAFGVGLYSNMVDAFTFYANNALKDCEFSPSYKVDFIWKGNNFSANDIIELAELNPICGQGIEQPKIAIENLRITKDNISLMSRDKSPTLKITLPNGVSLIKFGFDPEMFDDIMETYGENGALMNIVGTCNINEWNGKVYGQIQIEDFEICAYKDWLSYF